LATVSGGFENATALDAIGANLDAPGSAVDHGADNLQVRFEQARRDGGHVLTDTACFLLLTTAENVIPARLALATNFTTSRHIVYSVRNASREQ
jgi:hypothetical protein